MYKLFCLFLLLTVFHYGCQTGPDEVARVGSLGISVEEIKSALKDRYPYKEDFKDLDLEKKYEILNNIIKQKLKLNAAFDQDLEKNSTIVNNVHAYEEKLIIGRYHEKAVIDLLVPTEQLERFIKNQAYEIKVSHILIAYRDVNPRVDRTMEEAKELAGEIHRKLIEGADFPQMAEQYSDDPSVRENKGNLSYFTWGTMVPEFEETAWGLGTGGISEPVKTRFGYHIIRLEEKRERKDYREPETEEELFYIKRRLFMTHGDSGSIVWEKQIGQLKADYDFQLKKQNILTIATTITQKFNEGVTEYRSFSDAQLQMVLASWYGGKLTVQNLFAGNLDRLNRLLVRYKQAQFVEDDVESEGIRQLILAEASSRGINEDPYIMNLVEKFLETKLLQAIEKREISDKAEATEEEARRYYETNPEKFMKPAELELWEIFSENEELANKIATRARAGENFEKLAKKYSRDKKYQPRNGYIGFLSIGARGIVTREAFKLGPQNKVGGPLKYRNGWVIFKTGRKKESSIRPFDEVDNRAHSLVKRDRLNDLRVSWEASLKNSFKVIVDSTKLSEI